MNTSVMTNEGIEYIRDQQEGLARSHTMTGPSYASQSYTFLTGFWGRPATQGSHRKRCTDQCDLGDVTLHLNV